MASEIIEKDLYNELYHMVHNPNARGRSPRYKIIGDPAVHPKGVTTIMGQTLAKDLMQWAVDAALAHIRTKLPVVTEKDLETAATEYMRLRDKGGNTGSEAHAMVEKFLKDQAQDAKGSSKEATLAFDAFVEWFEEAKPETLGVEDVIYSKEFGYAGTYDCMLKVKGKVYLCDLKTTNPSRKAPNGVYAENFIQLGAYAHAYDEQRVYEKANGGTKLVKIDDLMVISAKKNGVLDICTASDLGLKVEECSQMFKRVMNVYQFMDYTTKKLGE